ETLEIIRLSGHLTRDRAMYRDRVAFNVFQDSLIGCRRSPDIVIGLQTIDRDNQVKTLNAGPGRRNLADRARHELDFDAEAAQLRQKDVKLAKAHQRLSAYD